jgi:GDPmannose 4,6-dehydratase
MHSALVTGITGQDGGYLAERMLNAGYKLHGLVRQGDVEPVDARVVRHTGDLSDGSRLAALVAGLRPDLIVNLGGLSSVAASWRQPVLTARVTGLAVLELLEAAWRLHDQGHPVRFLQASSAEIFGESTEVPQTEHTPIRPASPYGVAKALAHHATAMYRRRGLPASTVILYGHESPRRPPNFVARKITLGVAAIVRGRASDLVLGNLDATRDWGWAPDFVDAMMRVLEGARPDDYIVSTGEAHSVREFAEAAFAAAGLEAGARYLRSDPELTRAGDRAVQIGDASRIREQLGWAPTMSFEGVVTAMVAADLGAGG